MYRWLEELEGENVEAIETEAKAECRAGVGAESEAESGAMGEEMSSRRKRANFSNSFKTSVLAAYTKDGPAQASRQFGVSEVKSDVESYREKRNHFTGTSDAVAQKGRGDKVHGRAEEMFREVQWHDSEDF